MLSLRQRRHPVGTMVFRLQKFDEGMLPTRL